jgi:hypothetical protein
LVTDEKVASVTQGNDSSRRPNKHGTCTDAAGGHE